MALRLIPQAARLLSPLSSRPLHTSPPPRPNRQKPPSSLASTPATDFTALNMLADAQAPATAIEIASHDDGFVMNNGTRVGPGDGVLLVAGEVFRWRPWEGGGKECVNEKGQFEVPRGAFGVFDMLWPKPDLLVLGVGPTIRPLAPATREYISSLGLRVEVLDDKNAQSQYNLLATERGQDVVAAALMPWQ